MSADKPTPPVDPLAFIEGVNSIADFIDAIKLALVARGWDERMAGQAAVAAYQLERMAQRVSS